MKILIIQCLLGGKYRDLCTFSDNLEDAKQEMEDCKSFNPKELFRIIERTTTVVDEVIFQE